MMIFTCGNIGRGYSGLIPALINIYFLIGLATQNVYAHPYRHNHNKRNAVQFPGISNSNRGETQSDLEKIIQNDEPLDSERMLKRDTSSHENKDISNISVKILSRNYEKEGSSRERMQSDGTIVFPGEMRQVPVCKGSTYCESVDSYPKDVVNRAIQRNESIKYLASVDIMSDLVQRIDVTDDVPLCISTEQVIFPQSAENKDNQWKYVANQENFKQGVRIEKCRSESNSCSVIGGLAEGYKTTCKQKYVYRELQTVLMDGSIVPDTFRFPSSCCCHVSFNGNPLTRMAANIVEQKRSQAKPAKTRRRK